MILFELGAAWVRGGFSLLEVVLSNRPQHRPRRFSVSSGEIT